MERELANKLILHIWKMEEKIRALSRELDSLETEIAAAVEDD